MVERRLREGGEPYEKAFTGRLKILRRLFAETDDLRRLSSVSIAPPYAAAVRYLAAPPVSADDLKTFAASDRFKELPETRRQGQIVDAMLDTLRFPWILAKRVPTPSERDRALRWTAGLWAVETIRTGRRSEESREQEQTVRRLVEDAGFTLHLLREVGGKARQWQSLFGTQVVTAAVLRGVFRPANVMEAQDDYSVAVFWEHNLRPLRKFLSRAV
jgi:hypothetical protein